MPDTRTTSLIQPEPASAARDPVRTIGHILRAAFIMLGAGVLLWVLTDPVLVIFLAVLLAAMLRGLGDALARRTRLPDTAAVLLVFLALVVLICGTCYWIGPRLVAQAQQLWGQLSQQSGSLETTLRNFGMGNLLGSSTGEVPHMIGWVATSTLGLLGALLVIVATGVYLAIAPELYISGTVHLVPIWYRPRARQILLEMGVTLQGWLLGQGIDMVLIGVLVGGGLSLLGTPLALVLGVIAGLFTFVPYFGTIASAIPALLVGLTQGLHQVLWIVGLFLVAHAIEGYLVSPFVQRRTVHLPPALTVLAMVVLTAVFGMLGVLIATPLVAVLLVGTRRVYVEDVLGDQGGGGASVMHPGWYWFTPPER